MMGLQDFYRRVGTVKKLFPKDNWGFPFIVAFLFFLFCAAATLVISNYLVADVTSMNYSTGLLLAYVAEGFGDFAFFSLSIGVVLQIVYLTKSGRRIRE